MARLSKEQHLRRAEMVLEAFRKVRCRLELSEAVTPFYIWRTDNNQVLARNVLGYENARDKANELRKKFDLKWDQVKFKSERKSSPGGQAGRSRVDYARNYNPSKGRRFRGVFHPDGSYADLD